MKDLWANMLAARFKPKAVLVLHDMTRMRKKRICACIARILP